MSLKVERSKRYCYVSASTLTPFTLARHPRKHTAHSTQSSTPFTQACQPRKQMLAHHSRKHATHATHSSTNSTSFLKLSGALYYWIIETWNHWIIELFETWNQLNFINTFCLKATYFEEKTNLDNFNP